MNFNGYGRRPENLTGTRGKCSEKFPEDIDSNRSATNNQITVP
jgi:hypothetical protein